MTPDDALTSPSPPADTATRSVDDRNATRVEPDTADTRSEFGTTGLAAVAAVEAFQRNLAFAPSVAFDPPPGFELDRELGVGGMGVVYLARQIGLNRPVALKLVKATAAIDAKAIIRFLAEAEVVAAIRHPNVVEVYQYGEHGGKPYMALEYCPGGDLTSLTKSSPTRDAAWFRKSADLMAKVADGVHAAHAQGVVHRDLKPHNVFLTADGTPKVADFGLAKRGIGSDLTKTDAVMGTPAYMAPEQAGGGTKFVGPEADVWALGVMLYELACGERPIDTSGPVLDAIARVAKADVSQLRTKILSVPTDLSLVAHKCLSPDPRDRYPTAAGLATDLRNWLDGKPISARPAGVIEQAVKWAKRNKKLAGMGLAVSLTMAIATGVSVGFGLEADSQRKTAETKTDQVTTALNDLSVANERTQRTLARSLLGPISTDERSWLNGYERDAVWELAARRNGSVGLHFLEEATAHTSKAVQLRSRAEFLDHAVVGLDSRRRREADAIYFHRLRDPDTPLQLKHELAMTAVRTERYTDDDVTAHTLVTALRKSAGVEKKGGLSASLRRIGFGDDRARLLASLVRVCDQLPADQACDELTTVLAVEPERTERRGLIKGLVTACRRLPADRAWAILSEAVTKARGAEERSVLTVGLSTLVAPRSGDPREDRYEAIADALTTDLVRAKGWDEQHALAVALAAVAEHLPDVRANELCGRAADTLAASLKEGRSPGERLKSPAMSVLAEGLVAVVEHLPAERGLELLPLALRASVTAPVRRAVAAALTGACVRLPGGRTGEVCGRTADALVAAMKATNEATAQWGLAEGLAAVAPHLPAGRAGEVCGQAADILAAALKQESAPADGPRASQGLPLAEGLASVTEYLPAERAIDLLTPAIGNGNTGAVRRALRGACERLPGGRAVGVCGRTADALIVALAQVERRDEAQEIAECLVVVCGWLSAERATDLCGRAGDILSVAMETATDGHQQGLAEGLAAVALHLPAGRAVDLCGRAADVLIETMKKDDADFRPEQATGLAALCERLPAENAVEVLSEAFEVVTSKGAYRPVANRLSLVAAGLSPVNLKRLLHPDRFASVLGAVSLHPDALPTARPLRPQTLVDLLKHPFVVKEARRAVLDALEFTYDRQFADLWDFVDFAEKLPDDQKLDLLTPPKRPEKK